MRQVVIRSVTHIVCKHMSLIHTNLCIGWCHLSLYVGLEVPMIRLNTFNLHSKLPQKRAFTRGRGPNNTSSPSPIPQNKNPCFYGHLWLITPIKKTTFRQHRVKATILPPTLSPFGRTQEPWQNQTSTIANPLIFLLLLYANVMKREWFGVRIVWLPEGRPIVFEIADFETQFSKPR
jgi:hypothetical protein